MLIVEYRNDEFGTAYADYKAMTKAEQIINNLKKANRLVDGADDYYFDVSTSNIIDAFRVLVVRGKVAPTQIKFRFEGKDITINEYGCLSEWHKGFCDTTDKFLSEILSKGIMQKDKM